MKIGKVIGSVWATRKAQCLQGQTFLIVKSEGEEIVAADQVGAGPGDRVLLSVEEVIRLHGGSVYPSSYQPPEKFTAFQLQPVWELATDPDLQWNKVLSWLIEFQSYNQGREDFYIPFDKISGLKDFAEKEISLIFALA